ncbi:MAG TPA: zinc-ribbon domain-containing protein [Chthoniobacterales bacterium]
MAAAHQRKQQTPPICPVCGEDVPRGALACPECGADHNSGWREDAASYDGLDLPDEFDYDEFTRNEFGASPKPAGIRPIWWITAIVLLVLTLLYFVGLRWLHPGGG